MALDWGALRDKRNKEASKTNITSNQKRKTSDLVNNEHKKSLAEIETDPLFKKLATTRLSGQNFKSNDLSKYVGAIDGMNSYVTGGKYNSENHSINASKARQYTSELNSILARLEGNGFDKNSESYQQVKSLKDFYSNITSTLSADNSIEQMTQAYNYNMNTRSVDELQKQLDAPITTFDDLDLRNKDQIAKYLEYDDEAAQFVADYNSGKIFHSDDNVAKYNNYLDTIKMHINAQNEMDSRYNKRNETAYTDDKGKSYTYDEYMRNMVAENRLSDISLNSDSAKDVLSQITEGGNYDVLTSSSISGKELKNQGWNVSENDKINFTQPYFNELNDTAAVFSPIVKDENGNVQRILTPTELEEYAQGVLSGNGDKLNLMVTDKYYGSFANSLAQENSKRISRLSERYYNETDFESLLNEASVEEGNYKDARDKLKEYGVDWEEYQNYNKLQSDKNKTEDFSNKYADWSAQNFGTGALATAANVVTSPLQALEYVVNLGDSLTGYLKAGTNELSSELIPNIYNDKVTSASVKSNEAITSAIRSSIQGDGDNSFLNALGDLAAQTYGGVTSSIQSALVAITSSALLPSGIAEAVSLGVLSGQSANSSYHDVINNGGSVGQATMYSVASGFNEILGESMSIESLLNIRDMVGKSTAKELLTNILKQSVTEGTEEGVTEGLNEFADRIINGDKSEYQRNIQSYLESGFSDKEAKNKATLDFLSQVAWSIYGGFVGGAFSGGGKVLYNTANKTVNNVVDKINHNKQIKETGANINTNNNVSELVQTALNLPDTEANASVKQLAQKVQEYSADNSSKLSSNKFNKQVGKLYEEMRKLNAEQILGTDSTIIQSTIKNRLAEVGVTENIDDFTQAIYKQFNNEELTLKEKELVDTAQGQQTLEYLNENSDVIREDIENAQVRAYQDLYKIDSLAVDNTDLIPDKTNIEDYSFSDDNKTYIAGTDQAVEIKNIKSVAKNDVVVELADGSTESVKNLDLGSSDDAVLYQGVVDMQSFLGAKFDSKTANSLMLAYKTSGTDAKSFVTNAKIALANGFANVKLSNSVNLTPSVASAIYDLGVQLRQADDSSRVAKSKQNTVPTKSSVEFEDVDENTLNDRHKVSVEAMKKLSEATGINVVFYGSEYKNGKWTSKHDTKNGSPNGFYKASTNTMYLDVNAGMNGQGTILFTASHELAHTIREWSPKSFTTFANFLMEKYAEKGVDVDKLIRDKMNKLDLSYDEAYEEVVADSCESFLVDSNIVENIQELTKKDKGLVQKIKSYLKNLLNKIKKAYANLNPDSREGRYVRQMRDSIDELHNKFYEALKSTSENIHNANVDTTKNTANNDGVKYSYKENQPLTTGDLPTYLKTGIREHVRNQKHKMIAKGESVFLYSDAEIKQFISDSLDGKERNSIKAYARVGRRFADELLTVSDEDVAGYYLELDGNRIEHINDHIESDSDNRNIPLSVEEALEITEYIDTYTKILDCVKRKDGSKRIYLSKEKSDGVVVIVELISKGRGSIQPVTAWKNTTDAFNLIWGQKKKATNTSLVAKQATHSGYKIASDNIIPDTTEKSNSDSEKSEIKKYQARPDFDDFIFDDFDGEVTDNDARLITQYLVKEKNDVFIHLINTTRGTILSDADVNKLVKRLFDSYDLSKEKIKDVHAAVIGLLNSKSKTEIKNNIKVLKEKFDSIHPSTALELTARMIADVVERKYSENNTKYVKDLVKMVRRDHNERVREVRAKTRQTVKEAEQKKYDKLVKEHKEQRERYKESRNKTTIKNKIRNTIKNIDSYLNKGNNKKNVKEGMRDFASKALELADIIFENNISNEDIISRGVVGLSEREQKYFDLYSQQLQLRAIKEERYEKIRETASFNTLQSVRGEISVIDNKLKYYDQQLHNMFAREKAKIYEMPVQDAINALADAYSELQNSEHSYVSSTFDEDVLNMITDLKTTIGKGTRVKDMTVNQLNEVYKAVTAVLTTIRNANKLFGIENTVSQISETSLQEFDKIRDTKETQSLLNKVFSDYGYNSLKPIYMMRLLGSKTFENLFWNLQKGEAKWFQNLEKVKEFRDTIAKRYNYKSWDFKKMYSFTDVYDNSFDINLEQLMSIYALSQRPQGREHLLRDGFVSDEVKVIGSNKKGYKVSYKNGGIAHSMDIDTLAKMSEALTDEQRSYVKEMQKFLSTDISELGNEVSMKLYGIKLFEEAVYFPIKVAKDFLPTDYSNKNADTVMKSKGFTHKTVKNAGQPLILGEFSTTWANHCDEMAQYNALVLPLEDVSKVLNYRTSSLMSGGPANSLKQQISGKWGKSALDYIETLIRDINGGVRANNIQFADKLISLSKKASVFSSVSVVLQQPFAVARAMAIVNPKYFVKSTLKSFDFTKHNKDWAELKKYAPVAGIKEMGYFDTGIGQQTIDWILQDDYNGLKEKSLALIKDSNYRDEVLSKAPAVADELAWVALWHAVKAEIKDTTDLTGQAYYERCGERFNEVVQLTQVYDSVFSRSGFMRNKDTFSKMATAFMAEPTVTLNMTVDAMVQGKRIGGLKGVKTASGTIAAVIVSQVLTALAKSAWTAGRDDDKDKTYGEKYLDTALSEIINNLNPLNQMVLARDIVSLVQGYDVNRMDMNIFSEMITTTRKLAEAIIDEEKEVTSELILDVVGSYSNLFGIPARNIIRDINTALNLFGVTSGSDSSSVKSTYNLYLDGKTTEFKTSVNLMIQDKYDEYYAKGETKEDAQKKARQSVRSAFTREYKDLYLEYFYGGKTQEAAKIRQMLYSTGLYGTLTEFDKDIAKWKENYLEEQKKKKRAEERTK